MADTFSSIRDKFNAFSDDQRQDRLNQCMEIQMALNECSRIYHSIEQKGTKRKSSKVGPRAQGDKWSVKLWSGKSTQQTGSQEEGNDDRPKIKLEDTRAGMKISRFYEWGLVNPRAQAAIEEMREQGSTWSTLRPSPSSNPDVKSVNNKSKSSEGNIYQFSDDTNGSSTPTCCSRETHALWACRAMALGCATDLVKLKKCFQGKLGTTNPPSIHYDDSNSDAVSSSPCGLEQKVVGDCVLKNWTTLNERIEKRRTS